MWITNHTIKLHMMKSTYITLIFSAIFFSTSCSSSLVATANEPVVVTSLLQCLTSKSPSISKSIYTQNDPSFQSVFTSYIRNKRFSPSLIPKPIAIVTATQESHVQVTVTCAKQNHVQLRIRSGGHDYEALSYKSDVPFIIIDMFNLRSIDIDKSTSTVWAQAGAILGELYYKIANTSKFLGFPAGVCPSLGLGGHISGGGYGPMIRKYGLSVDNVLDARIVNANGQILDRKAMGEDVFWAIRGGGGASFGVILAWRLKLVPVPSKVTVFRVSRTLAQDGTDIVYSWQNVASKLNDEIFIRTMSQVTNGTVHISFIGFFLGQKKELITIMRQRFPELGLKEEDYQEMSWVQSLVYWADLPNGTSIDALLTRPNRPYVYSKLKSDYVKKPISKQGLEAIWKMMVDSKTNMWMQWNPYGGIMSRIPSSATPFPHRAGNLFKIQYAIIWSEENVIDKNIGILRKFHEGMTPYVSMNPREAFQNYRDVDIGSSKSDEIVWKNASTYGTKYFKNNYLRLTKVKAIVDPLNFFRHEQSIPPMFTH